MTSSRLGRDRRAEGRQPETGRCHQQDAASNEYRAAPEDHRDTAADRVRSAR
jgi:hypothetical protein